MGKKADKIVADAKGKINSKYLTNSGTSGFFALSTGYPSKPITHYLRNHEQLHYLMTNYTDGVSIDGDTTSLSDDQRNFICVTDSRVLIIVGDNEKDKTFEYKHKRIIDSEYASGIFSADKLKINSYSKSGNEIDITFPIREGSDAKAASQYINSKSKGIAPRTRRSRNSKTTTTNRSSTTASRTTPSNTGQKEKKQQTSTASNEDSDERKEGKEKEQEEIEEKIKSLRSDLYKIDSFITDAEYQEAENLAGEIKSEIPSLKEQASQENIDNLEKRLQRLERKCDERLSKSHVLTQLREMDPYEFEELVAKIWRKKGWDARVTSDSADRGVDVVATKDDFGDPRQHIQVKRHGENTKVGSGDIQRYSGLYARDEEPDAVFVVTSNRFTKEAKEVAKNRDVYLKDCDELYEMLTKT